MHVRHPACPKYACGHLLGLRPRDELRLLQRALRGHNGIQQTNESCPAHKDSARVQVARPKPGIRTTAAATR